MASNKQQQASVPESKQSDPQPAPSESVDCIIDDAEDCKPSSEPVPMFVQHTEAMMEEIERMDEEIEMEDLVEEPVIDIDGSDNSDSLAVVEYIDEIYAYYRKTEVNYYRF